MAFTFTDRNNKVVLHSWGRFKATISEAVVVGDLLALAGADATNAMKLADDSAGYGAVAVACQDGVAGNQISCAMAAELKAPTTLGTGGVATQVAFCATTDYIGSALYLGESGKVESSSGTTVQQVGFLTAIDTMLLVPGGSITGAAGSFTTLAASGATSLSSTLGVTGVVTVSSNAVGADFKAFGLTTGNYLLWDASEDDLTLVGTATRLTIAGTTESTSVTTGSLVTAGGFATGGDCYLGDDVFLTSAAKIDWAAGNVTLTHSTGLLTLGGGALSVGASGAGFDVTLYGETAGCNFLWDQNGDNDGSLILGADTTGVDFKAFGTTTGNYLLWDKSADDLTLVGTATQFAVAGTTAATSATTGSIHTAGGIGLAGALWVGTTSRLVGAVTSDGGISNTGDVASSVTMTTPSLRSAASGNVALVINAAGSGTIGIGPTSTGAVTITPATTVTGLLTTTGGITNNSAGIAAAGAISGASTIAASTSVTVTSASASALAVGRLGATTPALVVDASTATSITGVSIKSAAASGGVAVAAVGETNVALTINGAGSGTIGIGSVSTGAVTITPATTIAGLLTLSAATGISLTGTLTKGINFASATPAHADADDAFIAIGTWNDAKAITNQAYHFVPIQVNLTSGTSIAADIAAARFRVNTSAAGGTANTLTAVNVLEQRSTLAVNVGSHANLQVSTEVSENITCTGDLLVGYFSLQGDGAITSGNHVNVLEATCVMSSGASGVDNVAHFTMNSTGVTATNALKVEAIAGTLTNLVNVANTSGTVTNGINVSGAISVGVNVAVTGLHATTGRAGKFFGTVAAPNQGDGYGAFEVDITASGTFGGTTNAFSSWLNVAAEAVPGGNLICAQNNGIWLASGITASSAKMIMGMRMQYVADDGEAPGELFCFSTNIYSNVLTAIFDVNTIVDLGGSTGAATTNAYKIPLFKDASAGKVWYVNAYDG